MSNIQKNLKRQKLRNNEYYNFQEVQDELYAQSQNGKVFTDLMNKIICRENILLAYRNIKKNTGSNTKGVDGKTIANLAKMEPDDLVLLVRRKLENYQPQAVRRVEIPKPDGKMRPLGIPTISDRLVQQCILQVMEPICEAKFYKHSYGFRPLRSTKHAIARAYHLAQMANLHYVIDIDIKGFFDNIDHGKLLKQIWTLGIRDKSLLAVISKLLKAKIEGIGIPEKGTPQGGIISPLLANIVLNELDWWVASQWEHMPTKRPFKPQTKGRDNRLQGLKASDLKEVYIVRYADDFKIFCRNPNHAKRMFVAVQKWLKERLNLEINPEKSGIVDLKKNYSDFLGIKMKVCAKGKTNTKIAKNKMVVKSNINDKTLIKIITTTRAYAKKMQHPKNNNGRLAVMQYNSYVIGIHNYYCCATHCIKDFHVIASRIRISLRNRLRLSKQYEERQVKPYRYIIEKYGKSKQLRYAYDTPILPIAYIQHEKAFQYSGYSPYIASDREHIHAKQKAVSPENLKYLMTNPVRGQSSEYNDNRISLYVAQYGRCYVSGVELEVDEIHCHHKKPRALGGTDEYKNLVILHEDVHRLIHSMDSETINGHLSRLNLKAEQLERVNKLRELAKLQSVS